MPEYKIKIAADTNVGLYRQNNEDNFIVCQDLSNSDWTTPQADEFVSLGKYGSLLVVADGMGGMNAGEVASAITIQTIHNMFVPQRLERAIASEKSISEFLQEVIKAADLMILKTSKEDSSTQGMGTTIVLAWVLDGKAYVCWCGDSRCYVYNANLGLTRLSKDHSYVQDLVDKGELDEEYASDHPLSNVILRCLGDADNRAVPDVRVYNLKKDDILLLCSDGLSGMCHDSEIMDVMHEHKDNLQECKEALIQAALDGGGQDNVTVALGQITFDGEDKEEEKGEADTLQSTIKPKAKRRFSFAKVVLLVLLLFIVAGCCIWFVDDCEPIRQEISATLTTLYAKMKQ